MNMGQHQEVFLISLLGAISTGIFIGSELSRSNLWLPAFITFLLTIISFKHMPKMAAILCIVLYFLTGVIRIQICEDIPANDISRLADQEVIIKGQVITAPIKRKKPDGTEQVIYVLETESVHLTTTTIQTNGRLRVTVTKQPNNALDARVGDYIKTSGIVRRPTNFNNPGQIDWIRKLQNDKITATLYTTSRNIEVTSNDEIGAWLKVQRLATQIRVHYGEQLNKAMASEDEAMMFALMFGGYEGIKQETLTVYQATGMIHILSVSGSHISILAATAALICRLMSIKNRWRFIIGLIVIGSYAVIAGGSPPVVRATVMGLMVFLSITLQKESDNRRLLILTSILMLLESPLLLYDISFQLSVTSTAGIVYLAPWIKKKLKVKELKAKRFKDKRKLFHGLTQTISLTCGATIGSIPIVIWYFSQISLSTLITNITLVPVLELIVVVGLVNGIMGLIFQPISQAIFILLSLMLGATNEIALHVSKMPLSSITISMSNVLFIPTYYVILISAISLHESQLRARKLLPKTRTIVMILSALMTAKMAFTAFTKPEVQMHFIDVHQGDCALLITPHGEGILFDTGGTRNNEYDIGERVVLPYLRHYGINRLSGIFLTHAHADHAGGTGAILRAMEVDRIITSTEGRTAYANVFGMSEESRELSKMRPARYREKFHIDDVTIETIYTNEREKSPLAGNESSNVYRISYGEVSWLITGDMTQTEEEELTSEKELSHETDSLTVLRSDVIKISHHGSSTASSEEFLRRVGAEYAVISVGRSNSYGHPSERVLSTLSSLGVAVYRTDCSGAIRFVSDGRSLELATTI